MRETSWEKSVNHLWRNPLCAPSGKGGIFYPFPLPLFFPFSSFSSICFVCFVFFFRVCCAFAVQSLYWSPSLMHPIKELPMSQSSCPLFPTLTGVMCGPARERERYQCCCGQIFTYRLICWPPRPCYSLLSCPLPIPQRCSWLKWRVAYTNWRYFSSLLWSAQ